MDFGRHSMHIKADFPVMRATHFSDRNGQTPIWAYELLPCILHSFWNG